MTDAEILRQWVTLGSSIRVDSPAVDWKAASSMIAAAEKDAEKSRQVLKVLFKRSAERFPGFGDPLDTGLNFGAHRWLKDSREEAWSDWLAWILEQKEDSAQVLDLFRLDPAPGAGTTCKAKREFCTPDGRLDLVVRFGSATLLVEIKTISKVGEFQLEDYSAWLKRQSAPLTPLLLARDEPENLKTKGWGFCSWETVSMGLRTWASEWLGEGRRIQAALTLAFCGAVEQNLLGFGKRLNAPRAAEYLKGWMERNRDESR